MSTRFRLGDEVVCINDAGCDNSLKFGERYRIVEASNDGFVRIAWTSRYFEASRFRLAFQHAEASVKLGIDWKSLYENECGANLLNKNALRLALAREKGLKESLASERAARDDAVVKMNDALAERDRVQAEFDEFENTFTTIAKDSAQPGEKVEGTTTCMRRVVDEWKRMSRALFTADHYNWGRQGLTYETACRDLWNRIREGLGFKPVPHDEKLIPPRRYTFKAGEVKFFVLDREVKPFTTIDYAADLAYNIRRDMTKKADDVVLSEAKGAVQAAMDVLDKNRAHRRAKCPNPFCRICN